MRDGVASHLVEIKHARHLFIQPDRVACALPELFTRTRRQQRDRQSEGQFLLEPMRIRIHPHLIAGGVVLFGILHPPDHVDPGDDVSPLIRPSELEFTIVPIVQDLEVVRLEELVAELGERDALFGR